LHRVILAKDLRFRKIVGNVHHPRYRNSSHVGRLREKPHSVRQSCSFTERDEGKERARCASLWATLRADRSPRIYLRSEVVAATFRARK